MNAQGFERFEKLERANAQIDVWIDEEKYEKVMSCYKVNSTIEGSVESAFKEENNCTKGKDDEWANILNTKERFPIISITVIDNDGKEDNIQLKNSALNNTDSPDSYWSRFFWAKFIRAKIQEKGTNCCFRRLDQILTYLERNLPIVSQKDNDQNNKLLYKQLTVIYLLEMAAAGEGVDQRSFAMRARRLLEDSEFKKDFKDFYDLLARYNIGIGYFHEASYREAILQFNYIIYNWEKWELEKENNFKLFADSRKGKEFINIPSAIYRADIQLKLQLAYHAYRTTINKLDNNLSEYKKSKKHLIVAEVYQQLEQLDEFKKALAEVCPSAAPEIENDDFKKVVKLTVKECQYANIRGKLQSLYADWYLQNLKGYLKKRKHYDSQNKLKETEIKDYLSGLNEFYRDYKIFSKYTEFDRSGYLEQIAEYLVWLTANGTSRAELKDILKEEAKKIYIGDGSSNGNNDDNRSDLLIEEENEDGQEGDTPCPCEKKGIDLRQIREEHYNEFRENILTFFRKSEKLFDGANDKNFLDTLKEDKKKFLNRLLKVEKNRSNLEHRKRQFRMEGLDVTPPMWGGNNCMPSKCDYCKTDKRGTHCFFEHSKSNPSNNPTTIHGMQSSIPPVSVSDERDKPDGSSSVSMRQG